VAPDVLLRKLTFLRQVLADLAPYEKATVAQVRADHYKIERIFELLVVAATDIIGHKLAERQIVPDSYRQAFSLAAEQGWLPLDLAERLQEAAGMRNLIAHMYERIEYPILQQSIKPALRDFEQFVALFATEIDDEDAL